MKKNSNENFGELLLTPENINLKQSKKRLEQLLPTARLIDDYYFTLYAQCYPDDFSMIVSTFLDKDIEIDTSTVKYQKNLILPDDGKDVRFDVVADTKDGGQVVLEVESKKKFPELRLRYYMSRMDGDLLSKGEIYNQLKDSYVIVVSPVDMRKQNKPRYCIRSCYVESPTKIGKNPAIVDNGQVAVYINASYNNERDFSKLADLIHDFTCENPNDIKTEIIREHSNNLKSKGKEHDRMMALAENTVLRLPLYNGRLLTEDEQREAREEGMAKGKLETFVNYMTTYLKNPTQNINQAIQTCRLFLPDWDNNKFKKELTSLQKKLNIELNIEGIFLNDDITNEIKSKNFNTAYNLFCKNESVTDSEKPLEFMKRVVKCHGTDTRTLQDAVIAVTGEENETQEFTAKLLNDTLKSDEYKNAFEATQEKMQASIRRV